MKVLVLNGSPRMERSNTLKITQAFLDGFPNNTEREIVNIYARNIKPCIGCFSCWTKTPGKCVINDDMMPIFRKIEEADVIIESFPLYFFGIPGGFKSMIDRCLPLMKTYLGSNDKNGTESFHELRDEDMHKKKLVLISTCGYVNAVPMYPALLKQYDLMCGEGHYTSILCSEGELFGYDDLAERQKRGYLADITRAGEEFAANGSLSEETVKKLSKQVLSPGGFEAIVRSHWGGEEFPSI